jgi:hypothetical protein
LICYLCGALGSFGNVHKIRNDLGGILKVLRYQEELNEARKKVPKNDPWMTQKFYFPVIFRYLTAKKEIRRDFPGSQSVKIDMKISLKCLSRFPKILTKSFGNFHPNLFLYL